MTAAIIHTLLSTHADRQGVDILFAVCLCVQLRISPPRIKLAASNFSELFIGIQDWESPIFVNFTRSPKLDESASARAIPTCM